VLDRLLIPEKLYGRKSEVDAHLLQRLIASPHEEGLNSYCVGPWRCRQVQRRQRVQKGGLAPRLVRGGKFDQYKRDIPYATLAQAFKVSSVAFWAGTIRN
jgi:hypothetical protein